MTSILYTNSYLREIQPYLTHIRALHIDVLINTRTGDLSATELEAYLDALDDAGLKATLDVRPFGRNVVYDRVSKTLTAGELAALTSFVSTWKAHPAVYGYYADDEAPAANYPVATREQVYDTIHAEDTSALVVEAEYQLEAGAYSADVHDLLLWDSYPYNRLAAGGCIDLGGQLISAGADDAAITAYQSAAEAVQATLDAAGDNYAAVMQAFGHDAERGTIRAHAMPPAGGLTRIWGAVQAAGMDDCGVACFFLWLSNHASTLSLEMLHGIGERQFAAQRAEMSAIAATVSDNVTFPDMPALYPETQTSALRPPQFGVKVAGVDITDRVDYDSCVDIDSERGEASATIVIPVGDENEIPFNGLAQDAAVEIDRGGRTPWVGHVVRIQKPSPDNLRWELGCAGGWAELTRSAAWCRGFVAVPYAEITEMPPDYYSVIASIKPQDAFTLNTDGQVHFILPKGTKVKAAQGKVAYYWPFNGLSTIALSPVGTNMRIARVTGTWTCAGNDVFDATLVALGGAYDPFQATTVTALETVSSSSGSSGSFDTHAEATDLLDGDWASCLAFYCEVGSDVSETTQENSVQLTDLVVYFDRVTAPTIDEIVVEVDAEARPDGETASSETVGTAQTPFMVDPPVTPADGIGQALAKVATPPLCGVWQNRMTIKNRPSAPDGSSKLWVVSEVLTPGLEWGVEIDEEQSVDYVVCACSTVGNPNYPDGTQLVVGYPSMTFDPASARVGFVDATDHTDPATYAQQAYYWMHRLPQGPVVVPYVVHDSLGAEWPAEAIRAWDWVQNVGNLDDELAGPHLISDVARQGGIATLTIGNTAAYQYTGPERLAQAGKYVRAHWQRTSRKEWAKGKKRPKGGRWKKAKNGRWWRWKLKWTEGRYV